MKKNGYVYLICVILCSCSDGGKSVDPEKNVDLKKNTSKKNSYVFEQSTVDQKNIATESSSDPKKITLRDEAVTDLTAPIDPMVKAIKLEASWFKGINPRSVKFDKIFKERWAQMDKELDSILQPPSMEVEDIESVFMSDGEDLGSLVQFFESKKSAKEIIPLLVRKTQVGLLAASNSPDLLIKKIIDEQGNGKLSSKINSLVLIMISGDLAKSPNINLNDIGKIAGASDEFSQYLALKIMPSFGPAGSRDAESNPSKYQKELQKQREVFFENFPEPMNKEISDLRDQRMSEFLVP